MKNVALKANKKTPCNIQKNTPSQREVVTRDGQWYFTFDVNEVLRPMKWLHIEQYAFEIQLNAYFDRSLFTEHSAFTIVAITSIKNRHDVCKS